MELKNIKIDEDTWWKLNEIKVNKKLKRLRDVIKLLVKNFKK